MSDDLPPDWDKEPVKVLVSSNLLQVATNPSKAVFVVFCMFIIANLISINFQTCLHLRVSIWKLISLDKNIKFIQYTPVMYSIFYVLNIRLFMHKYTAFDN